MSDVCKTLILQYHHKHVLSALYLFYFWTLGLPNPIHRVTSSSLRKDL